MLVRPRFTLLLALAILLPAASAGAAGQRVNAFGGEVVDGPGGDIVRVGGADVARDGTGAVAYIKRDGGVEHVFVARLVGGVFQTPERVDAAVSEPGSEPAVAAADGGKVVVSWTGGSTVYAAVRPGPGSAFGGPQPLGAATGRAFPSVDIGANDATYVAWSASGDVRAARLDRGAGSFASLGTPLDADPAAAAGDVADRAVDVAVAADGVAVVVWGERGSDGIGHVIARKLFGLSVSQTFAKLDAPTFQNANASSPGADQPAVDIEDDSSYAWVVFRQSFSDGPNTVTRALARRQRGTAFDDPVPVDGLSFPGAGDGVSAPAIDLSGRGDGLAATSRAASGQVFGASLKFDEFLAPVRLDGGGSGAPVAPFVGQSDNGDGLAAFVTGSAGATSSSPGGGLLSGPGATSASTPIDGVLHVRQYDDNVAQPELIAAQGAFGPVDQFAGLAGGIDRTNDSTLLVIQGAGSERRLVATMFDRAPGTFVGTSSEGFRRSSMPDLRWGESRDLWGGCNYTVTVDDEVVGQTRDESLQVKSPIADGVHRWRVACTDRRQQLTRAPSRLLRIDSTPPVVKVKVTGTRKAGRRLRIVATVSDAGGSGVKLVRIAPGDGRVVATRTLTQVFGRRGSFTVRVSATDVAGNTAVVTQTLKIAKAKKAKKS